VFKRSKSVSSSAGDLFALAAGDGREVGDQHQQAVERVVG
jgi:hypothetical protein